MSGATHSCAIRKRLEILYKAAGLFWERGYHATTLESVLAACQVPKGSFHFYFASKRALATAVLEFYRLRCEMMLDDALSRGDWGSVVEAVCAAVAGVASGGWGFGCPIGNMGLEFANADRALAVKVGGILQMMEDKFAQRLAACGMRGTLARERGCYAVALLQGHVSRLIIFGDAKVVGELREDLLTVAG